MSKEIKYQRGADYIIEKLGLFSIEHKNAPYKDIQIAIRANRDKFKYSPSKSDCNVLAGIVYRKLRKLNKSPQVENTIEKTTDAPKEELEQTK